LFYLSGPWSRPYIIPDRATEQRLYHRHSILVGGSYVVLGLLIFVLLPMLESPLYGFGSAAIVTAILWLAVQIVHKQELSNLKRGRKLSWRAYYDQTAKKQSYFALALGLCLCLLLVAYFAWVLFLDNAPKVLGGALIVLFTALGLPFGYSLYLKRSIPE
jgi:uncharacterized membrane protein (DUF485 family)